VYRFSGVSLSLREQWPPYADMAEAEASVEPGGRDWVRELLEELTLLSAAWTGIPLFPRSSRFDEHERKER
jgi:hypothetical protein